MALLLPHKHLLSYIDAVTGRTVIHRPYLTKDHLRIPVSVVGVFHRRHNITDDTRDELISAGYSALLRAYDLFDPAKISSGRNGLFTYLYAAVKNQVARRYFRTLSERRDRPTTTYENAERNGHFLSYEDDSLRMISVRDAVKWVLQSVSDEDRLCFELYYLKGLNSNEIAGLISTSSSNVRYKISRGVRQVRAAMSPSDRLAAITEDDILQGLPNNAGYLVDHNRRLVIVGEGTSATRMRETLGGVGVTVKQKILQFLTRGDSHLDEVATHLECTQQRAAHNLNRMTREGLLHRHDFFYYRLTDEGRRTIRPCVDLPSANQATVVRLLSFGYREVSINEYRVSKREAVHAV